MSLGTLFPEEAIRISTGFPGFSDFGAYFTMTDRESALAHIQDSEETKCAQPQTNNVAHAEDRFANTDSDILHVRRVVAGNPNTPKQVLSRLSDDGISSIRRGVAENPKTPVDILRKLSADHCPEVRLAVAENPQTPQDTLSMLSEDEHVDVRFGVAENPHMPEDILLQLAQDDNPYVRCRALKTLQMLAPDVQTRLKLVLQPPLKECL